MKSKQIFDIVHRYIRCLCENADDIESLLGAQTVLVEILLKQESKVKNIKSKIKLINKRNLTEQKKDILRSHLQKRLDHVRRCIYFCKISGDALSFIFANKYALKQVYYNIDNYLQKQDAGFISGKEGLDAELVALHDILKKGVPAVLTDLTQTIRYGDICIMIGPDPILIEIKTNKNRDRRMTRQKQRLQKLETFFQEDKLENYRGRDSTGYRIAPSDSEISYENEFNDMLANAKRDGSATCNPEESLHYVAIRDTNVNIMDTIATMRLEEPWLFLLNDYKNERAWSPYKPFTLTFTRANDVWDFYTDELCVIVIFDTPQFKNILHELGYTGHFSPEKEYCLSVNIPMLDEPARISTPFLERMALEFVSPRWLLSSSLESFRQITG